MRRLGGIPVNRREKSGFVERMTQMLSEESDFIIGLAPEGTRRLTGGWRTGFMRLANAANVPVIVGVMDYGRKELGVLEIITLTGDDEADMARIARIYQGRVGFRPEQAAPIRLLDRAGFEADRKV
jgi:hypothetical protein